MKQWGGSGIDKFVRCKKDLQGNYYFMGHSSSDDYDLPANYNNGSDKDYWLFTNIPNGMYIVRVLQNNIAMKNIPLIIQK